MFRAVVFLFLAVGLCAGHRRDEKEEECETMNLFGKRYCVNRTACVGGAVAVTVGLPTVLGWIGFGPIGVIGGSLAALTQSLIGNVAAGSMFAALQSLAMTGGAPGVAAQALIASALSCGCLVAQN